MHRSVRRRAVVAAGSKVPSSDQGRSALLRPSDARHSGGMGTATGVPETDLDRNGLEVLDRAACLRLLAAARLGRIAITSGALPVILPVNFRLFGDEILFRTGRGTKLDAATRGAVVAFEVDAKDPLEHTGWSVLVTGIARQIGDDEISDRLARRIPRWAPEGESCVVAVSTELVSGRRIG
jgi:nitroimidazol reductase NimA-like FMN-containing flavoprotein (pyridoxamine 5'-phosphate oxidase superfamily)